MTGSVKDMIRSIRSCKTPAEERAVIARECADIRGALNGNSSSERRKNIAKLLLIHLMGHNTNFGQVECVKLVASSKFADKRIGYLGLSLLLNEDSEILTLAINSIKMDLNGNNVYAAESALNALGSLGTQEMFKELYYDLERLMKSPAVNVRKRAIVCAARMLRKVGQASMVPGPDAMELATSHFHLIPSLLCDHNHGIISAALTMLEVIIEYFPKCCNFPSVYELLVKTLQSVCNEATGGIGMMFGGGRDYEVNGVNDPFLKVKLLSLLRRVFAKCRDQVPGNQQLFDIVSQVVKGATTSNNASHALMYECVRTIYSEMHDPKFNQLGKDVVQKFISTNDNNIKYIALGILNNLVDVTLTVGDSNWNIIVQSLRQPDISIRRRALDVTLKLMSRDTVRPLMQHLYDFLLAASDDLKKESVTKIAAALKRHAESEYYRLETMVKIFAIAGNCLSDSILHSFIAEVGAAPQDTQIRVTTKLYYVLPNNLGQDALVRAALWCLGEYTHMLPSLSQIDVTPSSGIQAPVEAEPAAKLEYEDLLGVADATKSAVDINAILGSSSGETAAQVVQSLEPVAKHILTCSGTPGKDCTNGQYLLTCLGKLASRLPNEASTILRIVKQFKKHINTELQQRAGEIEMLYQQGALDVLVLTGPVVIPYHMPAMDNALLPMETVPAAFADDLLGLCDVGSGKPADSTVVAPAPLVNTAKAQKIDTLDFMSFESNDMDTKTKKNNDEFGEFFPF
ncbi:adaptin N terminal region family protein [Babesia ovis]|uniref:AP-1 complex subunit gamma n=1 Tax=Babesia ovis TaxID=5869 RepID=A0A9W5TAV0_BABOV|nr:adaptin N terminal region family protein [Babesia ovis]